MVRDKKSKVDDITKLRKILDNPADPAIIKMIATDDKDLDAIRKRLTSEPSKHQRSDFFLRNYDSLEPRITVHQKASIIPLSMKTLPEFQVISTLLPAPSLTSPISFFANEELYEVERVDVILPEFLEVSPKKPQETEMTSSRTEPPVLDQDLPQWQPVDEPKTPEPSLQQAHHEEPPVNNVPEFEPINSHMTPEPVIKPMEGEPLPIQEKPANTPMEFQPADLLKSPKLTRKQERAEKKAAKQKEKEARRQKKLGLKKIKLETREKEREAKRIAQQQQIPEPTVEEKTVKPGMSTDHEQPQVNVDFSAYPGIESIDAKTAELLYKNGYFSLENLRDATIDDLVQIQGIKRKLAKKIKQEVQQKTMPPPEPEFVPTKQKIRVNKQKKEPEDTKEWETYHGDEISDAPPLSCTYDSYTLYKRETRRAGGKKTTVYFFSKEKPDKGTPTQLPDGYHIAVNKKTRVPYLKKKK
jgi:hypothetical protein